MSCNIQGTPRAQQLVCFWLYLRRHAFSTLDMENVAAHAATLERELAELRRTERALE